MFKGVKIPKKINSPIKEAIFEIRYEGNFPGEALYGILFDVFSAFPDKSQHALPILQIPQQMREMDPNLRYQPFYRAMDKNFAFGIGPRSVLFSARQPYVGWTDWIAFIYPKIDNIQKKGIIQKVERMGLRTIDIFDRNIFENINASISINGVAVNTSPTSLFTEFKQGESLVKLNIGNAANIDGNPTKASLIDIDCIYEFNCREAVFYSSYKQVLEKMHLANKEVFFGLLKNDLLMNLNPEF
jgi:uncharacterized protein (TIGR04255 family)